MLQTFIPILSYNIINNKTFNIDYHSKSFFYKLDMNDIHVKTVTGFNPIKFEMVPGTNKIHCHVGGIDADLDLNGSVKLL